MRQCAKHLASECLQQEISKELRRRTKILTPRRLKKFVPKYYSNVSNDILGVHVLNELSSEFTPEENYHNLRLLRAHTKVGNCEAPELYVMCVALGLSHRRKSVLNCQDFRQTFIAFYRL